MLLNISLTAASLSPPSLAVPGRFDQCIPRETGSHIFRERQTCGRLQGLDPSPDYTFWTHQPRCRGRTNSKTGELQEYCLYTRANHTTQRGVSILTTPAIVNEIIELSQFDAYSQLESSPVSPLYEKRKLPGRGIGLIAARDIKTGETIMNDIPTLILDAETAKLRDEHNDGKEPLIWRGLLQLPKESRERTRILATSRGGDVLGDIAHTNGVGITIGKGRPHGAVLPELSRINHSCRPNAFYRFDAKTLIVEVLALREIRRGEELTISYTWTSVPTELRKKILREHWGFDCKCEICDASSARIDESDQRVMFILEAKEKIDNGEADAHTTLELALEVLELYDQEGLVTPKAEFELIAAKAADQLGDYETANRYAQDAIRYWRILAGERSDEVRDAERFARHLRKHYRLE